NPTINHEECYSTSERRAIGKHALAPPQDKAGRALRMQNKSLDQHSGSPVTTLDSVIHEAAESVLVCLANCSRPRSAGSAANSKSVVYCPVLALAWLPSMKG